jgi:hypothetical protein
MTNVPHFLEKPDIGALVSRRALLAAGGGAGALLLAPAAWAASASPLATAAEQAYLYALPLIENAESRALSIRTENAIPNRIFHDRKLSTPAFRSVTTPNNDTVFSRAWIDLGSGPVTIEVPATGDRYISLAFMDMFSNNFAIAGTRTTGGDGVRITLVGPGAAAPDAQAVRSPTRWVWMIVRTGVDSESDLPAVHAIQDAIRMTAPSVAMPGEYAGRGARWDAYFTSAQQLIAENVPPLTDLRLFRAIAPLGIGPLGGFDPARFDAAQIAEIESGIKAARAQLSQPRAAAVDGWSYSLANLGDFGQDYLHRAQTALAGLGALPREEAMYMRPEPPRDRRFFKGGESYRLRFPAGALPPVAGFWSMTLYERTGEGQFYLTENEINRYSIGDRTPGLKTDSDGSLSLWLASKRPAGDRAANWLPAPKDKDWTVVFRTYLPQAPLLNGSYRLPRLEPV